MRYIAVMILIAVMPVFSQDKPKDAPAVITAVSAPEISTDDKLQLRNLQLAEAQALQQLQGTPQWQAMIQSRAQTQTYVNSLITKAKVDQSKYILCDGPQLGGPCASVKAGEIQFKPIEVKK